MAKLKIFKFPDVVLTQRAVPIARIEKGLWKTADDMLETMYEAPGIGLAANQVGLLERMVVLDTEYELTEEDLQEGEPEGEVVGVSITNKKPIILFNPEIVWREGTASIEEGCLSVPEFVAEVKRAEKIKVQYQDIDGVQKTLAADGLLAIALQHELDHLDGKLFIDRLSPIKKEVVRRQLREDRRLRELEERMMGEQALKKKSKPKKGF